MTRRLLLSTLLLTLSAGCQKGPDGPEVHTLVQAVLDEEFKQGLFQVKSLQRNGAYAYTAPDGDTPQLLVYFKAQLQFLTDHDFSKWDQLGFAALATSLGANAEGISGVVHEGNKAGDTLKVFGTVNFEQREGEWQRSLRAAPGAEAGDRAPGLDEIGPLEKSLAELGERFRGLENGRKAEHVAVIQEEVGQALRTIGLRLDGLDGRPSFLSGAPGGEYHALGLGLAEVADAVELEISHYPSSGSLENCELVGAGAADFALVQNDIAFQAFRGQARFVGRRLPELRAVCSLYPEAIQVVVPAESELREIHDLRGKRLELGPRGSGSRHNALALLAVHGLEEAELTSAGERTLANAARALAAGEVDAVLTTSATPSRAIEELARERAIRLLPLSPEKASELIHAQPFLTRVTVPARTYRGLKTPVQTIGVTSMLVTHSRVSESAVQTALRLLFDQPELLLMRAPRASQVNPRSARVGLSLPLHPAAEKGLRQRAAQ